MIGSIDVSKKWEGRVVDGKFPLRQWLGGSDHSGVFLTERSVSGSQKAAIKIISVQGLSTGNLSEEAQLSRWADAAKLSHPHLLRLFEFGRCQLDGGRFLYVVMEHADENLAQILPERALSPGEVAEMLSPLVQTLEFLHRNGFAHGHIKPQNVMAVDNQLKISADCVRKIGEHDEQAPSAYVAPEVPITGSSPEADVWSIGMLLVAVLSQDEPHAMKTKGGWAEIPYIPQPFYGKAQRCLRLDPRERCTISEIDKPISEESRKTRKVSIILAAVGLLFLAAWLGHRLMVQRPAIPPAEVHPKEAPSAPAAQSPAPFTGKAKSGATGTTPGSVLHQALPDVSRQAQGTIQGHVKVSVQVWVDDSGNVSQAKLVSPGPSQYFASQALAAARRWKFNPPQVDGQASSSTWVLRFQFGRTSTQVSPTETKP